MACRPCRRISPFCAGGSRNKHRSATDHVGSCSYASLTHSRWARRPVVNGNQAEIDSFLQAPRHAIMGTIARDGSPQLSPVWYIYEEGRFYIGITTETAKYRNLRRDPRTSLCIDGGREDVRTVIVAGRAELHAKADPLQAPMRWRIISHYIADAEEARRYAKSSKDWDSVLIVITPIKLLTQNFQE